LNLFDRLMRRGRSHPLLGRLHREWAVGRVESRVRGLGAASGGLVVPYDLAARFPGAITHDALLLRSDVTSIDTVVANTERLADLDPRLIERMVDVFGLVMFEEPWALFSSRAKANAPSGPQSALFERLRAFAAPETRGYTPHRPGEPGAATPNGAVAILVTTFDRPAALSRSLPQIAALGAPVLVVDDGSESGNAAANRALCERHGVAYLGVPENRGLPAAMNVGLDYWLADPRIEWITYLQDDVDVRPGLLETLRAVQNKDTAPLITGFDAPDHPTVEVRDGTIKLKRTTPAVHLHAHRDYWASVMPIPSPYLGAPKPRIGASLEDWWITCHAPQSVEKRGILVPCLPGLVTTFLWHRDDSTWDNPSTGRS